MKVGSYIHIGMILCSFAFLKPLSLRAETVPILTLDSSTMSGNRIGSFVEYVQDSRPTAQFERVHQEWPKFAKKRSDQSAFSLGLQGRPYWFKLIVLQPHPGTTTIFLEHDYPSQLFDIVHRSPAQDIHSYRLGYNVPEESNIHYRNQTVALDLVQGQHEIYIRIEHHGAARFSFRLWSPTTFARAKVKEEMLVGMFLGISLLMLLYNSFTYLMLRSKVYLQYVGYLCATTFFLIFYSGVGQNFGPTVKSIFNQFWISSIFIFMLFMLGFTRKFLLLEQRMPRMDRAFRVLGLLYGAGILLSFFDPLSAFAFFQILAVPSWVICLVSASLSVMTGYRPARFYLIAFLAMIFGSILEGLVTLQVLGPEYSFWPVFTTYCIQMVLLSLAVGDQIHHDQNIAKNEISELNQNLQDHIEHISEIVEDKTRDIRSIMAHIPLGIFTITPDQFKIHKDYSQHLKEVFEQDELEGKNGCDLLFKGSSLTSDECSQAASSLSFSLGEDTLMFEVNSHCLPRELRRKRYDGSQRTLDLTWNPIVNSQLLVDKILITVRDVSLLRAMEEDANEKKEKLEFISEIINVPLANFRDFIRSCNHFLEESRQLIHSGSVSNQSLEALRLLFINMHTMKGSARSFHFRAMTKIFHDIEQYYAILQNNPSIVWDFKRMNHDLKEAATIIKTYEFINYEVLGRKGGTEKNNELAEPQLTQIYQELELLEQQWDMKPDLLIGGRSTISNIRSLIFPYIFSSSKQLLEEVCEVLSQLAKDLDKAKPVVTIHDHGLYLNRKGCDLIRRVFVHLLRNSMDHGIESRKNRLQSGKPENGHLIITLQAEFEGVALRFQDDGAGLDLLKLRELAKQRNLVQNPDKLSPAECAELIFSSGLSTAQQVNEISGRGVGMDAVRKYLEMEGGSIAIHLIDPKPHSSSAQSFYFLMRLPLQLFGRISSDQRNAAA